MKADFGKEQHLPLGQRDSRGVGSLQHPLRDGEVTFKFPRPPSSEADRGWTQPSQQQWGVAAHEKIVPYPRVPKLEMALGALEVASHPSLPSEDRGGVGLDFGEPGW